MISECLCNRYLTKLFDDVVIHNYFFLFFIPIGIGLDVIQQNEHDRRVAEAAVAKARIEWEKQLQHSSNQSTTQVIAAAPVPAPTTTIIHSGEFVRLMESLFDFDWSSIRSFRWFDNFCIRNSTSKGGRIAQK